ncbi:MAG: hypothetical protein R3C54_02255 [Parvularculaceae bacterium]
MAARDYAMMIVLWQADRGNAVLCRKLADMQTGNRAGLQGALALGRLIDGGAYVPEAISMMKRNNCGKVLEIARVARDVHAAATASRREYHVIRHAMNLETSTPK